MKHCDIMRQPCPNKPECKGCEALEQRNLDGSYDGIEMAATWRDWWSVANIVAMLLLTLLACWAGLFTPVVLAWLKTVFN